jgi:peptidoglycan/LPS O-acetylase OafA/YrhL
VAYHDGDEASQLWLLNALDLGSLGVAVFFVLSGCTLYISNHNLACSKPTDLFSFYLKRFFRIWPAFAVSLLAYGAFRALFQSQYGAASEVWIEHQFLAEASYTDVLRYLGLTFNITGPSGLFNNAYWSLPVEFQYYLIFPLLLLSVRFGWLFGPIVIAAVSFFAQRQGWVELHSNLVLKLLFTFAAGMMLGYLFIRTQMRLKSWQAYALAGLLLGVASLVSNGYLPIEAFLVIPGEWELYGLTGIGSVAVLLFSDCRLPALISPLLMKLGEVSYSLYLYHNLVIGGAVLGMLALGITSGGTRLLWVVAVTLPCSYLLAYGSHRWVEAPGIRIGRALSRLVRQPDVPGTKLHRADN